MIEEDYEEIETTIDNLQEDDLVYGTDGKWHSIKLSPLYNKKMYNFITENGNIICSYDHYWTLYKSNIKLELPTYLIHSNLYLYKNLNVGTSNGPKLISVKPAESNQFENNDSYQECRCVQVDSEDHQFEILTDKNKRIFTHNCKFI